MSEPVKFSTAVNRVCLPSHDTPSYNVFTRFYGYGLMNQANDGYSQWRRLNSAQHYIVDKCAQYPLRYTAPMLCSAPNLWHPCQGDSGGPLILLGDPKVTLIGLSSITGVEFTKKADCNANHRPDNYKSRFVSIKFLIDWIGQTMERDLDKQMSTSTSTTTTTTASPAFPSETTRSPASPILPTTTSRTTTSRTKGPRTTTSTTKRPVTTPEEKQN